MPLPTMWTAFRSPRSRIHRLSGRGPRERNGDATLIACGIEGVRGDRKSRRILSFVAPARVACGRCRIGSSPSLRRIAV